MCAPRFDKAYLVASSVIGCPSYKDYNKATDGLFMTNALFTRTMKVACLGPISAFRIFKRSAVAGTFVCNRASHFT